MHLVFLYELNKAYGIGILDSSDASVLIGSDKIWVNHHHPGGVDAYLVKNCSQLSYCETTADIQQAISDLLALGLPLATDPRLPSDGPPAGVVLESVVPTLAAITGAKKKGKK